MVATCAVASTVGNRIDPEVHSSSVEVDTDALWCQMDVVGARSAPATALGLSIDHISTLPIRKVWTLWI
jgi:hypothetical protein